MKGRMTESDRVVAKLMVGIAILLVMVLFASCDEGINCTCDYGAMYAMTYEQAEEWMDGAISIYTRCRTRVLVDVDYEPLRDITLLNMKTYYNDFSLAFVRAKAYSQNHGHPVYVPSKAYSNWNSIRSYLRKYLDEDYDWPDECLTDFGKWLTGKGGSDD